MRGTYHVQVRVQLETEERVPPPVHLPVCCADDSCEVKVLEHLPVHGDDSCEVPVQVKPVTEGSTPVHSPVHGDGACDGDAHDGACHVLLWGPLEGPLLPPPWPK